MDFSSNLIWYYNFRIFKLGFQMGFCSNLIWYYNFIGSYFAEGSSWEIYVRIGCFIDEMAAAMAGGQIDVDFGMVSAWEHREIWAKTAINGAIGAQEHDRKNPCFGHWST